MSLYFLISFLVCLASYILHTIAQYLECQGHKFGRMEEKFISVIIHLGYLGWGLMLAFDPVKINMSYYLTLPIGLLIGVGGLVLFVLSVKHKKGYHELDYLVTTGVYAKLKHPMYLGIIFMHLGLPILTKSFLTLLSAFLWIPFILAWKYWEEKDLEKKFGKEYQDYKKRTVF